MGQDIWGSGLPECGGEGGGQAVGGCPRAGESSGLRAAVSTALHTAEVGHKASVGHSFC